MDRMEKYDAGDTNTTTLASQPAFVIAAPAPERTIRIDRSVVPDSAAASGDSARAVADRDPNDGVGDDDDADGDEGDEGDDSNDDENTDTAATGAANTGAATATSAAATGTDGGADDDSDAPSTNSTHAIMPAIVAAAVVAAVQTSKPATVAPPTAAAPAIDEKLSPSEREDVRAGRQHFDGFSGADLPVVPSSCMWLTRLAVAAVSIALIWVTTLDLCRTAAASYFPAPESDVVYKSWSITLDTTQTEQSTYRACAIRQSAACSLRLNDTIRVNAERLNADQALNAARVASAVAGSQACSAGLLTVLDALNKYSAAGGQLQYRNDSSLGGEVCEAAELGLLHYTLIDTSQVKQNTFVLSAQYARDSNQFVQSAYDSANNRSVYDQQYITRKIAALQSVAPNLASITVPYRVNINFKTDALSGPFASLLACTTGAGGGAGCPAPFDTLIADFEQKVSQVEAFLALTSQSMQLNINRAEAYATSLGNALLAAKSFVNFIASYYTDIVNALPPNVQMPALPNLAVSGSLGTIRVPTPTPAVGLLSQYWNDRVAPLQNWLDDELTALRQSVDAEVAALQSAIQTPSVALPAVLADYNPPPLTVDTTQFADLSAQFLAQSAVALNAFDQLAEEASGIGGSGSEAAVNAAGATAALASQLTSLYNKWGANLTYSVSGARNLFDLRSSTSFRSVSFGGDFEFYPLLVNLKYLLVFFLIGDYVYRAYASVKEFVEFFSSASSTNLPVVDARQTELSAGHSGWSDTPMQTIKCLTSDTCSWLAVFIIGAIALVPLAAVYMPLYDQYQAGCIQSRNGTLLTRNLYSLTYNYASLDGNRESTLGLESYDSIRIDACTRYGSDSVSTLNKARAQLQSTGIQSSDSRTRLGLIQKCVIPSALPDAVTFKALTGVDHPFFGETSVEARLQTCDAAIEASNPAVPLRNASFDCSALPKCALTCGGPNQNTLQYSTLVTGCRTEWFIHSYLLQLFLATVIYVCINLSRTQLVGAVCRLLWRVLVPNGLTYVGTCTITGAPTLGLAKALAAKTEYTIRTFRNTAFLMIAAACIIHIPYLLILALLASPIPPWQTA